jgi:lycopene cyclase domain-containing protein
MIYEYLLFNIVVVAVPLAMSFESDIRFVSKWRNAFTATVLAGIPFIIWDIIVTGRHWTFNPEFTMNLRIGGLPVGEYLFFITVPFASLFVWEVLKHRLPSRSSVVKRLPLSVSLLLGAIAAVVLFLGYEYTGLAIAALATALTVDTIFNTRIIGMRISGYYLAFILVATLLFNGYLTARPVVLYNELYSTGIRLGTIPVEDFLYGSSLLILAAAIYEKLSTRKVHDD